MFFSSLFCIFTEIFMLKLRNFISDKTIFIVTQVISFAVLLQVIELHKFQAIFLVIPICGFSFATFSSIPEFMILKEKSQLKKIKNISKKFQFEKLLNLTMFLAQIIMFCIVPFIFDTFAPNVDDIKGSLIIAGICGGFSAIFAYFI